MKYVAEPSVELSDSLLKLSGYWGVQMRSDETARSQPTVPLVRVGEPCPDGPHRHTSSLHQTECDLRRWIFDDAGARDTLIRARSVLRTCLLDAPEDLDKPARRSVIERLIADITFAVGDTPK